MTSLEEVTWGIGLVAITMIIHAFAMPMTLAVCRVAERHGRNLRGLFTGVMAFARSTAVLRALAQRSRYEQLNRISIDEPVDVQ